MKRKAFARRRIPAERFLIDDRTSTETFFGDSARKKGDRKVQQICRQVERTVTLALSGGFGDVLLGALTVESVVPAPHASRLLINVSLSIDSHDQGTASSPDQLVAEICGRLDKVRGMLRHEVSQAITRKRAPELLFRVVAPGEVQP